MNTLKTALKDTWPYGIISLAVMLPLLGAGYIFMLDMTVTPKLYTSVGIGDNRYLFLSLLHVFDLIMPSDIIQKILLTTALLVAGIGSHMLLARLRPSTVEPTGWKWACYFAGVWYMINPFTYTRFITGQYAVLLGYALLPFLVILTIRFVKRPSIRITGSLTLLCVLLSTVSLHLFGIGVLLIAAVSIATIDRTNRIIAAKQMFLGIATFVLVSSPWLVPAITGNGRVANTVNGFTAADQQAFATTPGELGLVGNVLALQGFWGDTQNLYQLPQDIFAWWLLPICALWILVSIGVVWSWRHQRQLAILFGACIGTGVILSIGTAGTVLAPINTWLFGHVPFFAGYRETQKFAVLIVLGYAYFGSIALMTLRSWPRHQELRRLVTMSILLLPFLCAPLFLWGGGGQLKRGDYPADWYVTNKLLSPDRIHTTKVLFLPWHQYMPFAFAGRVIANPASKFFDATIISSNNPEIGEATGYATTAPVQEVDTLLTKGSHNPNLAHDLRTLNITYIIVAKDADYRTYDYLAHTNNIIVYQDMPSLKIYKIIGDY